MREFVVSFYMIFKYIFENLKFILGISKDRLHKALACFTQRPQIIYEMISNSFENVAIHPLLSVSYRHWKLKVYVFSNVFEWY